MATVSYQGRLVVVSSEPDVFRETPIRSFSVGGSSSAKVVYFESTTEAALFSALGNAAAEKSIAVFKPPSKDDLDSVLLGLAKAKSPFGFNFDIYAKYTKGIVQIIHFFQEDATMSNVPVRVGAGKNVSLKLEVSLPKADFKHATKHGGVWIDEDDWK